MTTKSEEVLSLPPARLYSLIIVSGIIFGIALAYALPSYLQKVADLGFRIPQDDLIADYTAGLVWAVVFGVSIFLWPIRNEDKPRLLLAWYIKCLVSLFVLLFLEAHYSADAVGYFYTPLDLEYMPLLAAQGVTIDAHQGKHGGTGNIWKLIWYYNKIIPDFVAHSYHSLKITFSMIGLIAIYIFYRTASIFTPKVDHRLFYFLVFFPSLLLYASRIGKESLMLLAFSLYFFGIVAMHRRQNMTYLPIIIFSVWFLSIIRLWVGIFAVSSLIVYFLWAKRNIAVKTVYITCGILFFLYAYSQLQTRYNVFSSQDIINKMQSVTQQTMRGGSSTEAPIQIKSFADVLVHAPAGIFKALFKPFPWDVPSLLGLASGAEGLFLLFLFFRALKRTPIKELKDPILLCGITLVLSWAFLYGFSIQNFGTAGRWRTQILPIFLMLLLYLGRQRSEPLKFEAPMISTTSKLEN